MSLTMIYGMTVIAFLTQPIFSSEETPDGYKRMIGKAIKKDPCEEDCYLKYFAGKKAPKGLGISNPKMSCICQTDKTGKAYFATYFDTDAGIAAYSAYTIEASVAQYIGRFLRPKPDPWESTPGITHPDIKDLYTGSSSYGIHKGHLNPSLINSYDKDYQIATFKYTNAVPQFSSSNLHDWKTFEGKIANYVKKVCGKDKRKMYLITGTSNYLLDMKTRQLDPKATIERFPNSNGIVRPNSLWTAGCCVFSPTSAESIAVWGDNSKGGGEATPLSLKELEKLLAANPMSPANLFPGFSECREESFSDWDTLTSKVQYP